MMQKEMNNEMQTSPIGKMAFTQQKQRMRQKEINQWAKVANKQVKTYKRMPFGVLTNRPDCAPLV